MDNCCSAGEALLLPIAQRSRNVNRVPLGNVEQAETPYSEARSLSGTPCGGVSPSGTIQRWSTLSSSAVWCPLEQESPCESMNHHDSTIPTIASAPASYRRATHPHSVITIPTRELTKKDKEGGTKDGEKQDGTKNSLSPLNFEHSMEEGIECSPASTSSLHRCLLERRGCITGQSGSGRGMDACPPHGHCPSLDSTSSCCRKEDMALMHESMDLNEPRLFTSRELVKKMTGLVSVSTSMKSMDGGDAGGDDGGDGGGGGTTTSSTTVMTTKTTTTSTTNEEKEENENNFASPKDDSGGVQVRVSSVSTMRTRRTGMDGTGTRREDENKRAFGSLSSRSSSTGGESSVEKALPQSFEEDVVETTGSAAQPPCATVNPRDSSSCSTTNPRDSLSSRKKEGGNKRRSTNNGGHFSKNEARIATGKNAREKRFSSSGTPVANPAGTQVGEEKGKSGDQEEILWECIHRDGVGASFFTTDLQDLLGIIPSDLLVRKRQEDPFQAVSELFPLGSETSHHPSSKGTGDDGIARMNSKSYGFRDYVRNHIRKKSRLSEQTADLRNDHAGSENSNDSSRVTSSADLAVGPPTPRIFLLVGPTKFKTRDLRAEVALKDEVRSPPGFGITSNNNNNNTRFPYIRGTARTRGEAPHQRQALDGMDYDYPNHHPTEVDGYVGERAGSPAWEDVPQGCTLLPRRCGPCPGQHREHALEESDRIWFGRFELRVKQIVTKASPDDPTSNYSHAASLAAVRFGKIAPPRIRGTVTCRICRGEGSEEEPLISPCDCKGSVQYIHRQCLNQWMLTRCFARLDKKGGSYFYKRLPCEICTVPYATHGCEDDAEPLPIVEFPKPKPPFIVLECFRRGRYGNLQFASLIVMSFSEKDKLTFGKDENCVVRFIDPLVSGQHANIKFNARTQKFEIRDQGSETGTCVGKPIASEEAAALGFTEGFLEVHDISEGNIIVTVSRLLGRDQKLGLNLRGMRVEDFCDDEAENMGWQKGDIITAVNETKVTYFEQFKAILDKAKEDIKNKPIVFRVYRGERIMSEYTESA